MAASLPRSGQTYGRSVDCEAGIWSFGAGWEADKVMLVQVDVLRYSDFLEILSSYLCASKQEACLDAFPMFSPTSFKLEINSHFKLLA